MASVIEGFAQEVVDERYDGAAPAGFDFMGLLELLLAFFGDCQDAGKSAAAFVEEAKDPTRRQESMVRVKVRRAFRWRRREVLKLADAVIVRAKGLTIERVEGAYAELEMGVSVR